MAHAVRKRMTFTGKRNAKRGRTGVTGVAGGTHLEGRRWILGMRRTRQVYRAGGVMATGGYSL